jgi:hypothetical protein
MAKLFFYIGVWLASLINISTKDESVSPKDGTETKTVHTNFSIYSPSNELIHEFIKAWNFMKD